MNLEELRFRKLEEHVQLLRQRVDALEGLLAASPRCECQTPHGQPDMPFFTPGSETP